MGNPILGYSNVPCGADEDINLFSRLMLTIVQVGAPVSKSNA
jgi:hypothetical protein